MMTTTTTTTMSPTLDACGGRRRWFDDVRDGNVDRPTSMRERVISEFTKISAVCVTDIVSVVVWIKRSKKRERKRERGGEKAIGGEDNSQPESPCPPNGISCMPACTKVSLRTSWPLWVRSRTIAQDR